MRKTCVLVVEDDPTIRRMMKRALPECDVHLAADGRAALEMVEAGRVFDIVFIDLIMPVTPGWVLFEHLKARSASLAERIIFVTDGAQTPRAAEFLATAPATRVLKKPFKLDDLRALAARSQSST